jgi:transposase
VRRCPRAGQEGGFGPRVQAITALCTGAYPLSKRPAQRALEDLCGVQRGLGTIANLAHATGQAVAAPVAEARAYVPQQPAASLETTGGREGRQRAWVWAAVTACVTVCGVRLSRSANVAHALLGEHFGGPW